MSAEADIGAAYLVALLSPCGLGNLGDALIQETFIRELRKRLGERTAFVGLTLNPEDTKRRHGIDAGPLYSWIPDAGAASTGGPRGRGLAASLPLRKARFARTEGRHLLSALRLLKRADLVVVSGGGQLDDAWGGAIAQPFALLKWTLSARLVGRPVAVCCVGAGSLDSRWSRRFVRWTLRLANHASVRDPRTLATVRSLGFEGPLRLVPDAALGFPVAVKPATPVRGDGARVIGVSPIAYRSPAAWWPSRDEGVYRSHLRRLAATVADLARRGRTVRIFTTDSTDNETAAELARMARLEAKGAAAGIEELATDDVSSLLREVQRMDAVVASRLHAVVAAQLLARPVLAVSYDWKVDAQMADAGLGDSVIPIESFEPDELVAHVERLLREGESVSERLVALAGERRAVLSDEFDRVAALVPRERRA